MTEHSLSKKCTKCGEIKPLSEFHKRAASNDGLSPKCKECAKTATSEWYAKNSDRADVKARNGKYRAANKGKAKEYIAKWMLNNRDRKRRTDAEWAKNNPERRRANNSRWEGRNQEKLRVKVQNYRARKRANGGRLSQGLADKLIVLQRGKCACGCAQPLGDDYHMDHRMPTALGGPNTDDNIQLLRAECNRKKGAKNPVEFMQERGFLI